MALCHQNFARLFIGVDVVVVVVVSLLFLVEAVIRNICGPYPFQCALVSQDDIHILIASMSFDSRLYRRQSLWSELTQGISRWKTSSTNTNKTTFLIALPLLEASSSVHSQHGNMHTMRP